MKRIYIVDLYLYDEHNISHAFTTLKKAQDWLINNDYQFNFGVDYSDEESNLIECWDSKKSELINILYPNADIYWADLDKEGVNIYQ